MSIEQVSIHRLKGDVLPALFHDPTTLGEYGAVEMNAHALHGFSNLMESGAVAALASKIGEIVVKLADANPQRIAEKPSWFERLLGREVERQVRYLVARKALDELLDEAQGVPQRVRDTLRVLDGLMTTHAAEAECLHTTFGPAVDFDKGASLGGVCAMSQGIPHSCSYMNSAVDMAMRAVGCQAPLGAQAIAFSRKHLNDWCVDERTRWTSLA